MNSSWKYYHQSIRIIITVILISCYSLLCYSQPTDSATFANANWSIKKISKGVKLHRYTFLKDSLFGSTQNISFIKTSKRLFRNPKFKIAADSKVLIATSTFAKQNDALTAINGNFFDTKNGGSVDFTKNNGVVVNANTKEKGDKLAFHQKAAVVIKKGKLDIKKWNGLSNWESELKETTVMLNGPLLLFDDVQEQLDSSSFNANRHPRTAVGTTANGRVIMLVVDGRNPNAAGMTLFELTKIMHWLGCQSAINFDGGGSSTLWVKDEGVVNFPSDNKKWDHEGERKVANVLFIK